MNKIQIVFYESFITSTIKFPILYFILILIQYISIFAETLNSIVKLNLEKINSNENFSMNVNKISPLYIIQNLLTQDATNKNFLFLILIISGVVMILLFVVNYIFIIKNNTSKLVSIIRIIFVNYCFIYFTIVIEIFYLLMFNTILNFLLKSNESIINFFLAILGIITLTYGYLMYVKNINVMIRYKHELEYHTDSMFGKMYNLFVLIMKILISLEINFQMIDSGLTKRASQLFNILKIFMLIAFLIFIFINLMKKNILYVLNTKFNLFKVFMLSINIFLIFLQFIFYESFKDITFILFCIISIFFSITVITKINYLNKENLLFYQELNGIKLIIFILGLKVGNKSKENKDISIEYNRFLIIHQSNCTLGKFDCVLCKKTEINDIFEFIESYYKYLKHQYKRTPKESINQSQELILIKLIKYFLYYECPEKNFNYNKLIYNYYRIIKKINKDSYIFSELEKVMCLIKPLLTNDSSIGPIIKKYENCCDLISNSIEEYDDFLSKSLYNSKNDITEFSQKLFINKTNIENNMAFIISQKNFFINEYHINIIRYNYVMLFNTELKCLNFAVFNEDLEETFLKLASNMFVLYNIKNDTFTIINSTSDFYKFRNLGLQEIFPKDIKNEGILKFKEMMLNNEDSKFSFDYVIEWENTFIKGIRMKCTILESTDKEEIFIICDYKLKNNNEIVIKETNIGNKHMLLMTNEISDILYLKPSHLKNIANSHIEMIFTTKGTVNQDDPNKNDLFTLKYKQYKEVHKKFMNEVKRAVEAEDIIDETIYEHMGEKRLDFFIRNYQTIQTKDISYYFYEILHMTKDTDKGGYKDNNFEEEEIGGDENQSVFQSSVNGGGSGALGITQTPNKKTDDMTNSSHVKKYIYSAIIINLIIIIYGVVSILIMSTDGSNSKNLYSVASLFYNMNKVFCITTNSFFSRVKINKIKKIGDVEEIDYFKKYGSYENMNIDLNDYVNEIVEVLLQDFTNKLSDYTKAVLTAKSIFGNELDYMVESFYINSNYDDKLKDYKVFFFNQSDSVNNQLILFINRIRTIFGSNPKFYNVTIFSFGKKDFSNVENKSLTDLEKYTYNSVMSYLNYLDKIFLKIQALIKLKTSEFLTSMNNRYILLYLGNIGVNLLFMLNCFVIISVFNIILKKQNEIFAKGINKDLSQRTTKRMKSLRILNNLYQTKPMPIIEDINKDITKSQVKADVKLDDKENLLNLAEQDNRVIEFIPVEKMRKTILQKIISYFTILFAAFAIIFAYSSVNFDSLRQTLSYVEYNFNTEAYLISNVNTLQVMLVSNQTDIEIYKYLNGQDSTVGQVRWKINNFFNISATYQANYYFKQSVDQLVSQQVDFLNCNKLVEIYDANMIDAIIKRNPKFEKNSVVKSLTTICSKLNYMNKYSDFNILFSEIIYRTQYILNKFEFSGGDYKKIKEVYDDPEFFGLKALIILFLRPISTFYSKIQDSIVISSFNGVLMFNVLSVVINIFLDILMLILIYRVIIIMLKTLAYYKSMEVSFRIL